HSGEVVLMADVTPAPAVLIATVGAGVVEVPIAAHAASPDGDAQADIAGVVALDLLEAIGQDEQGRHVTLAECPQAAGDNGIVTHRAPPAAGPGAGGSHRRRRWWASR